MYVCDVKEKGERRKGERRVEGMGGGERDNWHIICFIMRMIKPLKQDTMEERETEGLRLSHLLKARRVLLQC